MIDPTSGEFGALPEGLAERIKPELAPGEVLHWAARSNARTGTGEYGGPFQALLWGLGLGLASCAGFALLARDGPTIRAYTNPIAIWSILAGFSGLVGLLIAVFGALGRRAEIRRQRLQVDAMTDRRAIIWTPEPGSEAMLVQIVAWAAIKPEEIRRSQFPDGSGSVLFRNAYPGPPGFLGVEGARRVEWLLREPMGSRIDDQTI